MFPGSTGQSDTLCSALSFLFLLSLAIMSCQVCPVILKHCHLLLFPVRLCIFFILSSCDGIFTLCLTFFFADYVPSPRPECRFPQDYRGEWMQFQRDRKESVTIASGEITFSNLGHFICKTKHWAISRYKLMSVYSNGW